jgi:hypothetical protein
MPQNQTDVIWVSDILSRSYLNTPFQDKAVLNGVTRSVSLPLTDRYDTNTVPRPVFLLRCAYKQRSGLQTLNNHTGKQNTLWNSNAETICKLVICYLSLYTAYSMSSPDREVTIIHVFTIDCELFHVTVHSKL